MKTLASLLSPTFAAASIMLAVGTVAATLNTSAGVINAYTVLSLPLPFGFLGAFASLGAALKLREFSL